MKRIGLLIVLFIGFSAINGYGSGLPDPSESGGSRKAYIPRKGRAPQGQKGVDSMGANLEAIKNDMAEMGNRVEKLETRVEKLETRVEKLEDEHKQIIPGPQPPVPPGNGPASIPINWEIIREQKDNLGGLNYYVSKDISLTIPGLVKTGTRVRDGILEEIKDERSEEKLEISQNIPGKMLKFSAEPADRESLEIFFSANPAILTFTRNKTKNCFELTSVRKDGREFVFKGETIQLYIKYKRVSLGRTTGETGTITQVSGQHREPAQPVGMGGHPAIPKKILLERGRGYLTQEAVVDYTAAHGCHARNLPRRV